MADAAQTVTIDIPDAGSVDFTLDPPRGDVAFFVLGVRKCGSSIFNSMMHDLAGINGYRFVDVAGTFFEANIKERSWWGAPAAQALLRPGHVYGGFRAMPPVFASAALFARSPKVLLVRDPRDALVSEYFSNAYSHSVPQDAPAEVAAGDAAQQETAREIFLKLRAEALATSMARYVRDRADDMNRTLMAYAPVVRSSNARVFRYEDVIFEKRTLIADVADHFGWDGGSPGFLDGMMGWADKLPAVENPREFIRRVRPGDHREKLDAATIAELNVILAPSMALFGYSAD